MFEQCYFSEKAPQLENPNRDFFLIYDSGLKNNSFFNIWKEQFKLSYSVDSGEELKQLDQFSHHIDKIQNQSLESKPLTFVAAGGGSVGDFVGFLASVYKRGVPLIHVPTTYLAAIDSAHGGKSALNMGATKNQIGTFKPADKIYIIKDFLSTLSEEHLRSACGELVKMAFIEDLKLYFDLQFMDRITADEFWERLPLAVKAKYDVVEKDPEEKSGYRQILNLGHSFGHLVEAQTGMPHGKAVAYGLLFALGWSKKKDFLNREKYKEKIKIVESHTGVSLKDRLELDPDQMEKDLRNDKKKTAENAFNFIFVRSSGEVLREEVMIFEFMKEYKRQGWK